MDRLRRGQSAKAPKRQSVVGEPNWRNRTLFHGDNLKFLRGMNSESVDLIATDPPFNKGRDFHATPDSLAAGARFQDRWSWERDVHQTWVDQITDDFPKLMEAIESARYAHSDGMGAFMCFMAVRLLEMHRVLKPTGSIYLHCDPTASHYLKAVMDAVFGWKQFRNELIWSYRRYTAKSNRFQREHDVILFFGRETPVFNVIHRPYGEQSGKRDSHYKQDEDGRWFRWQKLRGQEPYKIYLSDRGRRIGDVWPLPHINASARERTGYPTQKPLELYERVIKASSNAGGIVLDPFCGCATTCVAAERLGRKWVGIDIWDKAHEVVLDRLKKIGLAVDGESAGLLAFGDVHYETEPPTRTDEGTAAVAYLQVRERIKEPEGKKMSRAEMYEFLLTQYGSKCQGCDRMFDDSRYLQLDHNTPRADGGLNHITNRVLLCGPCNQAKSNIYTLSGLRRLNKRKGWMAK